MSTISIAHRIEAALARQEISQASAAAMGYHVEESPTGGGRVYWGSGAPFKGDWTIQSGHQLAACARILEDAGLRVARDQRTDELGRFLVVHARA